MLQLQRTIDLNVEPKFIYIDIKIAHGLACFYQNQGQILYNVLKKQMTNAHPQYMTSYIKTD